MVLRTVGIIVTPIIPISRYFLRYHSVKQIYYGLLTGFICATAYFCMIVAIIHINEGKFWGHRVTNILKKVKFTENILHFEEAEPITNQESVKELAKKPVKETPEGVSLDQQVDQESFVGTPSPKEDTESQIEVKKELRIVLPLREGVRRLICLTRTKRIEVKF